MSDDSASQARTGWKWIGFIGSGLYGAFFIALVWFTWPQITMLSLNALGDFFAGLFAPLALLWLVLGFFQQGEELRLQAAELNASVKHAGDQAAALSASEKYTKQEIRWHTFNNYIGMVSSLASDIYFVVFQSSRSGRTRQGSLTRQIDDDLSAIWARFEQGDREIVLAKLLGELSRSSAWQTDTRLWSEERDGMTLEGRIKAFERALDEASSSLRKLDAPDSMLRIFDSGYGAQLRSKLSAAVNAQRPKKSKLSANKEN